MNSEPESRLANYHCSQAFLKPKIREQPRVDDSIDKLISDEKPVTKTAVKTRESFSLSQTTDLTCSTGDDKAHSVMTVVQPSFEKRKQLQRRPDEKAVMFQTWQKLLFLHWRFDPIQIQKLLPPGLTVDTHQGSAWIGVVPFYMRSIRPVWSPVVPYVSNFLELNVRTYAYDENGLPGVWFLSLDANRWLAAQFGKTFFRLPYFWGKLTAREDSANWIKYSCRRFSDPKKQTHNFRYRGTGAASAAVEGTLDFFLVERYILFTELKMGQLATGQVHHTPYEIQTAEFSEYSEEILGLHPLELPGRKPDHAVYSEGVDVEVFGLNRI